MVTELTVKLTTPLPEFEALNKPVNVAEKLSLPAIGTDWVIVNVKVPDAAMLPLPLKKVWKLPKLESVGLFKDVDPNPVNVIIRALPIPPRKVTEFVPLPAQPTHVKVPEVEKVKGSAFAVDTMPAHNRATTASIVLKLKVIGLTPSFPVPGNLTFSFESRIHPGRTTKVSILHSRHPLSGGRH